MNQHATQVCSIAMDTEECEARLFYEDAFPLLQEAQAALISQVERMRLECAAQVGRDPADHWKIRTKTISSTKNKLERLGLPVSGRSALKNLHDLVGIRVICTFVDDVYHARNWFARQDGLRIVEERDYIRRPKPNGYRSYHLIVELSSSGGPFNVEIQLRTLAMDCWAALEHQLKYKNSTAVQQLMVAELKRCADEIASTDLNLLSIRDMIEAQSDSAQEEDS